MYAASSSAPLHAPTAATAAHRARVRWGWTTVVLLVLCLGLLALLVVWLGWLPLAVFGVALLISIGSYLAGHSAELRAMKAVPADPYRHRELIAMVHGLARIHRVTS